MSRLRGKVALVTGAGSGLGEASAKMLASEGVRLGLFSRTAQELDRVAAEIENAGGEAAILSGDVAKPDDLAAAIAEIDRRWGRLDIVFANAGINGVWAPLELLRLEEWEQTLRINLTGTFLTVKAALPLLKKRGGSIVITSSVNGTRMFSNTGATAYSCSKAAQVAFTKMIAVELARSGIRVNVICPGFIESSIHEHTERREIESVKFPVEYPEGSIPLTGKKPGHAEQVANVVRFLACDESSHVTGSEFYIDGGQSLLEG